ncbi:hypothetical protein RB653_009043 [Dictyostelium firmibasis]|uniref:ABC transporter domain-containing protein n=1 Tax=Dictyostelium firmibasis TaxID=79012 RepID=A0AAN7YSZ7_9MYCE
MEEIISINNNRNNFNSESVTNNNNIENNNIENNNIENNNIENNNIENNNNNNINLENLSSSSSLELYNNYNNNINNSLTNLNSSLIANNIGVQVIFENISYKTENRNYKKQLKDEKKRKKKLGMERSDPTDPNPSYDVESSTPSIQTPQSRSSIIPKNSLNISKIDQSVNPQIMTNNGKIEKEITILSNVSGIIEKGEMVGLFGPSGSGKSTLLDILANRKSTGTITGKILVNGKEIGDAYKKYCSYVTQEEILLQTSTVEETLKFHADLRLPGSNEQEKWKIVEQVIKDIGLTKKAKSKIGGILPGGMMVKGLSGGEKKRVSIGCALVTNPSLVFLDEPTSGLDSLNALKVMKVLMNLTVTKGVTVICSIHQPRPEIYHLFNKIMIILKGRMIYCGNDVLNYFSSLPNQYQCPIHTNPADFILDTCHEISESDHCEEISESWETNWRDNMLAVSRIQPFNRSIEPSKTCSLLYQYKILVKRNFKDFFRNSSAYVTRLSGGFMIGLLFSACFGTLSSSQEDVLKISGILFFLIAVLNLIPFTCITLFISNREIFNSERASKIYHSLPFYLSSITTEAFIQFLVSLIVSILVYSINHLRWNFSSFFITYFILYLINLLSDLYIIAISNITGKSDLTFIYGTTISITFLLFMGHLVPVKQLPKSFGWIHWINPLYYGYATVMVSQFKDYPLECPSDFCQFPNGNDVLKFYGLEDWTISKGIGILIVWICFFFVSGYWAISKLNKEKR